MSTPRWGLFAAVVILATLALLSLSLASARVLSGAGQAERGDGEARTGAAAGGEEPVEGVVDRTEAADEVVDQPEAGDGAFDRPGSTGGEPDRAEPADGVPARPAPPIPSGGALLANVALTHGLVGVTVVGLAWFAGIPPSALGLGNTAPASVVVGVALGAGLYVASEVGTAVADRVGVEHDEHLRELLAPEGPDEWALLLLVTLPVIAGAEELLFRAALIGALGAGFDVPVWALVVVSSVLFGAGHGAQGVIGVAVTAALGLVLGTAFVLTGSFVVVVVAHYVVNALEFVVREGLLGRRGP